MTRAGKARRWAAVVALGAGVAASCRRAEKTVAETPTTQPVTQPAATPGARAAKPLAPPPFAYLDVVKANVPAIAATQPLALPLDLPQAAHLILKDPLYLDGRLNLWVTRPEAPPTADVLRKENREAEFLVPERVLFVHWAPDERDALTPRVVTPRPDGGYDYVTAKGRARVAPAHDYRWDRAKWWEDKIIVPSRTGVSVFRFTPDPVEQYQELIEPGDAGASSPATNPATATRPATRPAGGPDGSDSPEPQLLYDGGGFLAWVPWEHGKPGGRGAARYAGGKWVVLDAAAGWPDKLLHLIPLLGGSVMQLVADDGGKIRVGVTAVGEGTIDRKEIERLVIDLAEASQKTRDDAFARLTRFGPAVRPILRELLQEEQPPEAQARMRQLLRDQVQPLLGPMTLMGDKLEVVSRQPDGGAVFYTEAGVTIDTGDGDPLRRAPAWLAVRPGRAIYLLPDVLVADVTPGKGQLTVVDGRDDDWVVVTDARGPKRFVGNGLVPLLRKEEAAFTDLVGVDRRGRWLFRKPGGGDETLVLDPTIPEPRLPVWNYASADAVGWDKDNWPAVKQLGLVNRLKETGWEPLNPEKGEELLTRADQIPAPATKPAAAAQPATTPSSTSQPAPLLVAADGTRYWGGVTELKAVAPAGGETTWPLPGVATGQEPVTLLQAADGRLYLFNQPGRVLRIKPTPAASDPFTIEATFTRNIPSVDKPTRVWLDPAGRIVIAYGDKLAILFPSGYIPPALKLKMVDTGEEEP